MATRAGKKLLTREDWTRAALEALAERGVPGIAVDRLAKELGATRGSFYWHFRDRRELVDAALALWERESTTELMAPVDAIADPIERLRTVFAEVYERPVDQIELALAATASDPVVGKVVARVTKTRLDFLGRIFTDLGLRKGVAKERAWLAYAFYVGHHQLGAHADIANARPASLEGIVRLLAGPEAEARRSGRP